MFINFSNHPSSGWKKEQVDEAMLFGDIKDVSFPTVEPSMDYHAVSLLANECAEQISSMLPDGEPSAVHIMGESTLCYAVVRRLRDKQITCLASTTERIKKEMPDGTFVSSFIFCQFRPYE